VGERICSAEGCEDAARARGLCNKHYCRARASGVLIPSPRKPTLASPTQRACSVADCGRPHLARDLCGMHYGRALRTGALPGPPAQMAIRLDQHLLQNIDLERKVADCLQCGLRSPIRVRRGRSPECLIVFRRRARRARLPPKTRRRKRLRRLYKLSPAEYEEMLRAQDGVCAICRQTPPYPLYIDHCHRTGRVRGLLCAPCNTGLGMFRDSPERAMRAAAYLAQRQK